MGTQVTHTAARNGLGNVPFCPEVTPGQAVWLPQSPAWASGPAQPQLPGLWLGVI